MQRPMLYTATLIVRLPSVFFQIGALLLVPFVPHAVQLKFHARQGFQILTSQEANS
jgi:hypothetical protein